MKPKAGGLASEFEAGSCGGLAGEGGVTVWDSNGGFASDGGSVSLTASLTLT